MDEPNVWGTARSIIFLVVLALHLALLSLILMASRTRPVVAALDQPIELIVIPPMKTPRMRMDNSRPERLSTDIAIALAPPILNSSSSPGPSSAPDGHGSAVNWAAEAHRAVQAFEIRQDQPEGSAASVSPGRDEWWPRPHHAGDQFKTAAGDWIVWINANCYQVASWHAGAPTSIGQSPTICQADKPRGN